MNRLILTLIAAAMLSSGTPVKAISPETSSVIASTTTALMYLGIGLFAKSHNNTPIYNLYAYGALSWFGYSGICALEALCTTKNKKSVPQNEQDTVLSSIKNGMELGIMACSAYALAAYTAHRTGWISIQ